jgi:hypothetical protein
VKYSEQLRDPRWQRKRLETMQRDDWKCCRCSRGDVTLNVHHREYINGRMPWEYELEMLETLCEPCHNRHHELGDMSDDLAARILAGTCTDGDRWAAIAISMCVRKPKFAWDVLKQFSVPWLKHNSDVRLFLSAVDKHEYWLKDRIEDGHDLGVLPHLRSRLIRLFEVVQRPEILESVDFEIHHRHDGLERGAAFLCAEWALDYYKEELNV